MRDLETLTVLPVGRVVRTASRQELEAAAQVEVTRWARTELVVDAVVALVAQFNAGLEPSNRWKAVSGARELLA